jgi:copper chaperone
MVYSGWPCGSRGEGGGWPVRIHPGQRGIPQAVTTELTDLAGVTGVSVELVPGGTSAVTVSSEAPLSGLDVAAALDEAGDYRLVGG